MSISRTIATNDNNDIYLDSFGNIAMATDMQSILQTCENVSKTRLGEMMFATDQGIPYFETIFNGSPHLEAFSSALRSAILQVVGVDDIISMNFNQISNNSISYTIVIRTYLGQGTIQNVVNI